jgi:hypothetical protein
MPAKTNDLQALLVEIKQEKPEYALIRRESGDKKLRVSRQGLALLN